MNATLDAVIHLADQLSLADRELLITHLLEMRKDPRDLTLDEFEALLDAATVTAPIERDISNRREDWYGDDGR
jgi:hypothetical protein